MNTGEKTWYHGTAANHAKNIIDKQGQHYKKKKEKKYNQMLTTFSKILSGMSLKATSFLNITLKKHSLGKNSSGNE